MANHAGKMESSPPPNYFLRSLHNYDLICMFGRIVTKPNCERKADQEERLVYKQTLIVDGNELIYLILHLNLSQQNQQRK